MANEQELFKNRFGTVTSERITFSRGKGLFSGGAREDVPLKHVTSVRVEVQRKIGRGIFTAFVAFGCFGASSEIGPGPGWILAGIFIAAWAVMNILGVMLVAINTAGGDLSIMRGWFWERKEAEEFAKAVRNQLFAG